MTPLYESLERFGKLVEARASLSRLLQGWEPYIHVEAVDTLASYTLVVKASRLAFVLDGLQPHSHLIVLRGVEQSFLDVFSGALTAAEAVMDGHIEVYGSDKDLVKLDALTLVLLN